MFTVNEKSGKLIPMADFPDIDETGRVKGNPRIPHYVKISSISSETGISERTLRRWCACGELPAINLSLGEKQPVYAVTREDVIAVLTERRVSPPRRDVGADVGAAIRRKQDPKPATAAAAES